MVSKAVPSQESMLVIRLPTHVPVHLHCPCSLLHMVMLYQVFSFPVSSSTTMIVCYTGCPQKIPPNSVILFYSVLIFSNRTQRLNSTAEPFCDDSIIHI